MLIKKEYKITKRYPKFYLITNSYLNKIFPLEIILKIYKYYIKISQIKSKWLLIYIKYYLANISNTLVIKKLHEYHEFARKITFLGHEAYKKKKYKVGEKLIKLSSTIHFLVCNLIQKTIGLRYN